MKNLYDEEVTEVDTTTEDTQTVPETGTESGPAEENPTINAEGFDIDDMITNYAFGMELTAPDGTPFPKSMIASYLNAAIAWAEQLLDISLTKKVITEELHDYERSDYQNWGYVQLWKRPVKEVTHMELTYGGETSFVVPQDWIKVDKIGGKIQMFPAQGSANNLIISQSGVIFGLQQRWSYAPQMWSVDYVSGMDADEVPENLKNVIMKKAMVDIFTVYGDIILGAGIASQSISIDGLSQSIGTTQSAMFGGMSARCEQYKKDIDNEIPVLRMQFSSPRMIVL